MHLPSTRDSLDFLYRPFRYWFLTCVEEGVDFGLSGALPDAEPPAWGTLSADGHLLVQLLSSALGLHLLVTFSGGAKGEKGEISGDFCSERSWQKTSSFCIFLLPFGLEIWPEGPLGSDSLFCRGGLCSGRCCEPPGLWVIFRSMYSISALCWICFSSVLETLELENARPLLLDATASCSMISTLTWLHDASLSIRWQSFSGSE